MADQPEPSPLPPPLPLKDPAMAGFLAWLVPGLGHFYQGRYAKGAIFAVCIWSTFIYGLYLGSSREVGVARVVYCSFRSNDLRLYYLCQVGAGLPALPAIIQYIRVSNGREPLTAGKFEAPPRNDAEPEPTELRPRPQLRVGHALHLDRRLVESFGRLRRLLRTDDLAGQERRRDG